MGFGSWLSTLPPTLISARGQTLLVGTVAISVKRSWVSKVLKRLSGTGCRNLATIASGIVALSNGSFLKTHNLVLANLLKGKRQSMVDSEYCEVK
jgi:hypothetical protein